MTGPKASLTWWSFADRGVEAEALIRAAAAMGYDGIELADEALWPPIADAGLAIASHRGHGTIEDGLNRRRNHGRIDSVHQCRTHFADDTPIHQRPIRTQRNREARIGQCRGKSIRHTLPQIPTCLGVQRDAVLCAQRVKQRMAGTGGAPKLHRR